MSPKTESVQCLQFTSLSKRKRVQHIPGRPKTGLLCYTACNTFWQKSRQFPSTHEITTFLNYRWTMKWRHKARNIMRYLQR